MYKSFLNSLILNKFNLRTLKKSRSNEKKLKRSHFLLSARSLMNHIKILAKPMLRNSLQQDLMLPTISLIIILRMDHQRIQFQNK